MKGYDVSEMCEIIVKMVTIKLNTDKNLTVSTTYLCTNNKCVP